MLHIKDDFSKGPVSQVPTSWFNSVGKFVNNLVGGRGIKVSKNGDSTPSVVEIDPTVVMSAGIQTTPTATHGASLYPDFTTSDQAYQDNPAWKMYDDITGLDGTTPAGWERGKTAYRNGVPCDETHHPVGCSITVCTHTIFRTVSGVQNHVHYYSQLDFDENGLLVRVIPCTHWHRDA